MFRGAVTYGDSDCMPLSEQRNVSHAQKLLETDGIHLDVALAGAYRQALLEEFTWWVGFRVTLWGTSQ